MELAWLDVVCRTTGERLGELFIVDRSRRGGLQMPDGEIGLSEYGDYLVRLIGPNVGALRFGPPVEVLPVAADDELLGVFGRPPGLGVVRFEILGSDGVVRWRRDLPVRPEKLSDETEFMEMVSDLCRWRTALALDLQAGASAPWVWADSNGDLTPEERLVVARAAIEDHDLFANVARVERSALVRLGRDVELVRVGRDEIDPARLGRYVNGPGLRMALPQMHPLAVRLTHLPVSAPPARKIESVDTPENQFVKLAVRRFRETLSEALRELSGQRGSSLVRWAQDAESRLARLANSSFFSKVSWPAHVALGSPSLQRREGYRSVLRAFLDLASGFSMPWEELGKAVFAETREVPTLYELWCLLQLRTALETELGERFDLAHFLVDKGRLRVRRGAGSQSAGAIVLDGAAWSVVLYYNRTFGPTAAVASGEYRRHGDGVGTWSKPMKPDFTVALRPLGIDEREAAETGRLRLVHFDAKYRLRKLVSGEAAHVADDLDKMHAYVAAIHHSRAAYALFPGDKVELLTDATETHAVGAIAVTPGRVDQLGAVLRQALERAVRS